MFHFGKEFLYQWQCVWKCRKRFPLWITYSPQSIDISRTWLTLDTRYVIPYAYIDCKKADSDIISRLSVVQPLLFHIPDLRLRLIRLDKHYLVGFVHCFRSWQVRNQTLAMRAHIKCYLYTATTRPNFREAGDNKDGAICIMDSDCPWPYRLGLLCSCRLVYAALISVN